MSSKPCSVGNSSKESMNQQFDLGKSACRMTNHYTSVFSRSLSLFNPPVPKRARSPLALEVRQLSRQIQLCRSPAHDQQGITGHTHGKARSERFQRSRHRIIPLQRRISFPAFHQNSHVLLHDRLKPASAFSSAGHSLRYQSPIPAPGIVY